MTVASILRVKWKASDDVNRSNLGLIRLVVLLEEKEVFVQPSCHFQDHPEEHCGLTAPTGDHMGCGCICCE